MFTPPRQQCWRWLVAGGGGGWWLGCSGDHNLGTAPAAAAGCCPADTLAIITFCISLCACAPAAHHPAVHWPLAWCQAGGQGQHRPTATLTPDTEILSFLSIDNRYISTLSTSPTGSVSSLTRSVGKSVTAIYYPRTTQLGAGSARLGRARTRNVAIITQTAPAPAPAPAASTVAKSEWRD